MQFADPFRCQKGPQTSRRFGETPRLFAQPPGKFQFDLAVLKVPVVSGRKRNNQEQVTPCRCVWMDECVGALGGLCGSNPKALNACVIHPPIHQQAVGRANAAAPIALVALLDHKSTVRRRVTRRGAVGGSVRFFEPPVRPQFCTNEGYETSRR